MLQKLYNFTDDGFIDVGSTMHPQPRHSFFKRYFEDRPRNHCNVHDFSETLNVDDFDCIKASTAEDLKVCVFPNDFVSDHIRRQGVFEPEINVAIMEALDRYPKATFLDIGANIGIHCLTAAKRGRKVVAVEPKPETVQHLHKSVNVNHFQDRFVLVQNAVSDVRTNLTLYHHLNNQGGSSIVWRRSGVGPTVETIFFDDLLEVFRDAEAVVKMDIEAAEPRALAVSYKFFQQVNVHVIFMEWDLLKRLFYDNAGRADERRRAVGMTRHLRSLGFSPAMIPESFNQCKYKYLDTVPMSQWPMDIVWVRKFEQI